MMTGIRIQNISKKTTRTLQYVVRYILQVHVDGHVTFHRPLLGVSADSFWTGWNVPMLAVFMADIDLSVGSGGRVFFHEYRRHPVYQFVDPLPRAEQLIFDTAEYQVHEVVGDASFYPSNVVVVTWQNVSPYSPDRSTSDEVRR